ncbi:MAG TPA: PD-(D/E)XK nuclease family protein [Gaiellaceae bacterium]|nr:PD-(D/E)XK nuclease family protein [Gaiellaceae bacterium]
MPLSLIAGPANAGKVELLLDRYLAVLDRDPYLIVPNRSDVDRTERELLARRPALLSGEIGTFDDLFERIAGTRPSISQAQRALLVRRVLAAAQLDGLAASARFGGFADGLLQVLGELESGLLDPAQLEGDLASLYAAYRAELDRLALSDRNLLRRRAAERLQSDLDAWHGEPVFAYGFEDLTGAEWALLEALAARAEVTVSLPYEPGRPAFASLQRTAEDLAKLAGANIEELPPRYGESAHSAIAHLERALFADVAPPPVPIDGAVRFFEGAGIRGALELVGEELLDLLRAGTPAERIGVICPSSERLRAPLETALGTLGVPYSIDGELRLAQTPYGQALVALLRFAWLGGTRRDLFTFLRSPFSGVERRAVDFVEGRLRGRAIQTPERVVEESEKLRGSPLPGLAEVRDASDPIEAVRELAQRMLRHAHGVDAPPAGEASRLDLRASETVTRLLAELERWRTLVGELSREDVMTALERQTLRPMRGDEPGRVAVVDLLRARTRRFDSVFILGLEEGSLPRRGLSSPFLDDDTRRALDEDGARLLRPDSVSRDRYLFYTACTRPLDRLYLVREAASDEGSPREASPFWDEVQAVFDPEDVRRWTRRRPLSSLTWRIDDAPTERERLRALAELASHDVKAARALADANGWQRRLDRALRAFRRDTKITHPLVLEQLGSKRAFNVTELERFADCSSAWFVERFLDPRSIDQEVDAKLRGSVAHSALFKFFTRFPKELAVEKLEERIADDAVRLMRACLDEALQGVRMEMTEMQMRELDQTLWRDLEVVVREECESPSQLVPRRFEVAFGSERAAPELQRGLDLGDGVTLTGKIDRIDVDPFSARGIVQDYKSGKKAHSAVEIEREMRLQIPLYMLVLRDLVGMEPLGGLYRPLAGERKPRGLLRKGEAEVLPGYTKTDYLDEDAFWAAVESAQATAQRLAGRIRAGDIEHDPKGGDCPQWCDLWPMCRVPRA